MVLRFFLLLAACLLGSLAALPAEGATRAKATTRSQATNRSKARVTKKTHVKKPPRWPTIHVLHINRRETFNLKLADDRGRPIKGIQKRVDRFLRCHYTNKQFKMNPRLTRLIYETGRHFPGKRIEVVSGYRDPSVAKNPRSPHMRGLATDLRVAGVKNTELRDYLRRTFKQVGIGYYPNSSFVHLDVRKGPSAFWIDYSGPGQGSLYAGDAQADLKTGKAEWFKPTTIDPSWADDGDWLKAEVEHTGAPTSHPPEKPAESAP